MTNKITVTPDYTRYYSEKSKEWAISDKKVDNTDYSSKYYANESKKQADISTNKTTEVVESGNTAVSNIESARDNAINDITNQETTSRNVLIDEGATQVELIQNEGATQVNLAKEQVVLATNQANIANQQATIATNKTSEVVASGNTALSNIATAKNNAITTITTQETTSKNNVIATGNEQVERVNLTGVDNRTPIFTKSEVGTNESIYQNVYDLKHSTFDKSKFTVVGSPTITDDGVASGFSGSNYIQAITNVTSNTNWQIVVSFLTPSDLPAEVITILHNYLPGNISNRSEIFINGGLLAANVNVDGINIAYTALGSYQVSPNTQYRVKLEFTGSAYNFYYSTGASNWTRIWTVANSNNVFQQTNKLGNDAAGVRVFNGSIDLKHFSITVDGKEVFNGNKTGIDQIKKVGYTNNGALISDDGIFEVANTAYNYITIPKEVFQQVGDNAWSLEFDAISPTHADAGIFLLGNTTNAQFISLGKLNTGGGQFLNLTLNNNGVAFRTPNSCYVAVYQNVWCKYIISYDGNETYKLFIMRYDTGTYLTASYTSSYKIMIGNEDLRLGQKYNQKIDLNSVKLYISGELAYQADLKIPYTQSKTGSKIVDAVYRDRVIDLYEQKGNAWYFTIDETNKNFTLPMGEIYGMKADKSDLDLKTNLSLNNLSDTGKKVIDGQWVQSVKDLSTATDVGGYTLDLTDYLPVDDYNYEVMFSVSAYYSGTSGTNSFSYLYTGGNLDNNFGNLHINLPAICVTTDAAIDHGLNCGNLIIGKDRKVNYKITGRALTQGYVTALQYRRLGTNS